MSGTDETIKIFQIVACSLSLSGSLFMILVYFMLGMRQNFALKLIMYLTISDMIFSVSNLSYLQPGLNVQHQLRCTLQAFFIQYSQLACFIFCFLLCLCIYWTVIKNRNNLGEYNLIFLLIGFGVPLFIAIIPLFTKSYGTLTYVCGIGNDSNTTQNKLAMKLESGLLFYTPLWLLNIIGIYFIVRVSCFMTKLRAQSSNSENSLAKSGDNVQNFAQEFEIRMSQRITENMLAYPIIMLCCWSGMTIYAVAKLCDSEIHVLKGIRFIMADCLGLCNSIAYGVNALIIIRLRKILAQQPTTPMIQLKTGSGDSTNRKQFESFLSIATQNE